MSDIEDAVESKKRKLEGQSDMTSPPTDAPEPEHSTRFYDDTGSLEILSSDHVLYKVQAFYLQAASPVFRTMIASASGCRIELCDPVIETAAVFVEFLDLLINSRTIPLEDMSEASAILKLCLKYDCESLIKQIQDQLRCAVIDGTESQVTVMVLGAVLGQPSICKEAIAGAWQTNGQVIWDSRPTDAGREIFGEYRYGARVLDPASLSFEAFQAISTAFMWCWMRSHQYAFPADYRQNNNRQAMGRELERLANLPGAPKPLGGP